MYKNCKSLKNVSVINDSEKKQKFRFDGFEKVSGGRI